MRPLSLGYKIQRQESILPHLVVSYIDRPNHGLKIFILEKPHRYPLEFLHLRLIFCEYVTVPKNRETAIDLICIITESQDHRMVRVGRDLCGSSSPKTPAEAGSPTVGCTEPCLGGS